MRIKAFADCRRCRCDPLSTGDDSNKMAPELSKSIRQNISYQLAEDAYLNFFETAQFYVIIFVAEPWPLLRRNDASAK